MRNGRILPTFFYFFIVVCWLILLCVFFLALRFLTTFDKMRNTNWEDVLWFSCLSLSWSHPWEASTSSPFLLLFSFFSSHLLIIFFSFTYLLLLFLSFFFTLLLLLFFIFQLQILKNPNSLVSWQLYF